MRKRRLWLAKLKGKDRRGRRDEAFRSMNRSSLTTEQVRLILRIYLTDRYLRRAQGFRAGTPGIKIRLAAQFGVNINVIKQITILKHPQPGKRRVRFPLVNVAAIRQEVKTRLVKIYGAENVSTRKPEQPKSKHRRNRNAAAAKPPAAGDG